MTRFRSAASDRPRLVAWARLSMLLLLAVLAAAPLAGRSARAEQPLGARGRLPDFQREIERMIETTDLGGGIVSVSVVDADRGTPFTAIRADEAMIPASNMKLLTTGAALHVLGPEFRFTTRLVLDGGRLIVLGDGDPGFGDPVLLADTPVPAENAPGASDDRADDGRLREAQTEFDVDGLLDLWVDAVVAAGVVRLDDVLVDDRIFDREYVHPGWPGNQLSRHYCAGVSGVNFHANVLTFYPYPTAGGGATAGPSIPRAGFLEIENNATADRSRPGTASVERRVGSDRLILQGNIRTAYEFPIRVTMNEPPRFFARLLTERLRQAGVDVASFGLMPEADPTMDGDDVAPRIVTPIARVLERANTNSHNLSAEALFKRIAAHRGQVPATFIGGASMVREAVRERLGDERLDSRLRVSDGSGLSRQNMVPAGLLTQWLRSFHADDEVGPMFRASLAVMGRTGTLRKRLTGTPPRAGEPEPRSGRYVSHGTVVRAKSGTIDGVSALTGYVVGPERTLCFSVMVNGFRGSSAPARDLQDRIVMLLSRGLAAEARPPAEAVAGG